MLQKAFSDDALLKKEFVFGTKWSRKAENIQL